jgi:hypothetical protein
MISSAVLDWSIKDCAQSGRCANEHSSNGFAVPFCVERSFRIRRREALSAHGP